MIPTKTSPCGLLGYFLAPLLVTLGLATPALAAKPHSPNVATHSSPSLQALMARHHLKPHNVAILIRDGSNGQVVFQRNANQRMLPASTEKLVTTIAALNINGADYRWHTSLNSSGPIVNHTLMGDLWLQGGNDPYLTHEQLNALAQLLKQSGVERIQGSLRVDRSLVQVADQDPNEFDGEGARAYNQLADAFMVDFGLLTVHVSVTNGHPASLQTSVDAAPHLPVDTAYLKIIPGTCVPGNEAIRVEGVSHEPYLKLIGSIHQGCDDVRLTGAWLPRHQQALWLWMEALKANNIAYDQLGGDGQAPPQQLVHLDSPPLLEVIAATNRFSNNVMARQIFLSLGDTENQRPLTVERSRLVLARWLNQEHLCANTQVDNGSGLSRLSRLTVQCLNDLLWHEHLKAHEELFKNTLATPTAEGTLKHRLAPLINHAWLKTGHLNGVDGIAGWIEDLDGHVYIVSLLINGNDLDRVSTDAFVDQVLLLWTQQHRL